MSTEVALRIQDIEESTDAYMGKTFLHEFASSTFYMNLSKILNQDELEAINPSFYDVTRDEEFINPHPFLSAINKIYQYLIENKDVIPLVHEIGIVNNKSETNYDWRYEYSFKYNNLSYYINGDIMCSYSSLKDNKLIPSDLSINEFCQLYRNYFIIRYRKENVSKLIIVKVEPIIDIANQQFKTRTLYRYQLYETQVNDLISICNKAISLNKDVSWAIY